MNHSSFHWTISPLPPLVRDVPTGGTYSHFDRYTHCIHTHTHTGKFRLVFFSLSRLILSGIVVTGLVSCSLLLKGCFQLQFMFSFSARSSFPRVILFPNTHTYCTHVSFVGCRQSNFSTYCTVVDRPNERTLCLFQLKAHTHTHRHHHTSNQVTREGIQINE